jgi:hypothetical protein
MFSRILESCLAYAISLLQTCNEIRHAPLPFEAQEAYAMSCGVGSKYIANIMVPYGGSLKFTLKVADTRFASACQVPAASGMSRTRLKRHLSLNSASSAALN